MRRFGTFIAIVFLTALAAGCSRGDDSADDAVVQALHVTGAKNAVLLGDVSRLQSVITRPSAPLAVFASVYMSGGGFLPASAAMQAVITSARFHARPSDEAIDNTYALLQEFGIVLQVDLADLLNRSDDRAETLDSYLTGLKNITGRSNTRAQELEVYIDQLRDERGEKRNRVSDIEREARDALEAKDYVTAGEKQQSIAEAEAELNKTETTLDEQEQIRDTFADLLEVAGSRIAAIAQNREVLIAGLKVVDVPEAESLGILEQEGGQQRSRRRNNELFLF